MFPFDDLNSREKANKREFLADVLISQSKIVPGKNICAMKDMKHV